MTCAKKTKENLGVRFTQLREAMSQKTGAGFFEFCKEAGIREDKLKAYEAGELWPDFADLQAIGLNTGVNLNWLVYQNGGMFGTREKDMEEMIQKIEADETGRYNDYKMLLKILQIPALENFIFGIQKAFLDFLATTDFASLLKEPGEFKKMLPEITLPQEKEPAV